MTKLPSGTVTFLFTDLEGSTGKWEQHPDAMRVALARHDAILRDAVESNGGHVVKSTGDGVHAVFAEPGDAVVAAADAMGAFTTEPWGETGPLRIRIGIHTGEADERDGDYFGLALNRASRLMSAAHPGQLVCSADTAALVRDALPHTLSLVDLGEHRLRGLERAERVFGVAIAGLPSDFPPLRSLDAFPGRVELPPPSFAPTAAGLAGRRQELARFETAWERAVNGRRQIVLVAGEPGIGKTRIVGAVAHTAHAQGAAVCYGRCDEEPIVPYQPFVEALRPCIGAYATSALEASMHGLEPDLARVFPELAARIEPRAIPVVADPEAERFRFFEAISTLVSAIATAQPTLVVIDDLHWADKPTLLLLRHLVRATATAPLMLVLAYRDVEARKDLALEDLLADLHREPGVTRILLEGLSAPESSVFVHRLAGQDIVDDLVTTLHRETGGNPFFLEELFRHLDESGALPHAADGSIGAPTSPVELPPSVRDVIARRLRRLPDTAQELLTTAAIAGPEFDSAVLERALGAPVITVLDTIDDAVASGLLRAHPDAAGRYVFTHALVRQTLLAGLSAGTRARLHARVGLALEEVRAAQPGAAELALHFRHALPITGARKAVSYALRAGREAIFDLAYEEAVEYFRFAVELLEQHEPDAHDERIDALTELAGALLYVDEREAVETALLAVDTARDAGSAAQFGRAVAVAVEPVYGVLAYPDRITALFDEARKVLGSTEPALQARLRAFEAFKYATHTLHDRAARALAEEAVELARGGDAVTTADAVYSLAVSLEGTTDLDRRVDLGHELLRLGATAGPRASAFGLRVLAGVHLERGDADSLTSTVDDLTRIAARLRWVPAHAYAAQFRATQALLEGRFTDFEACADELHRWSRAYRGAAGMRLMQAAYLAREQGEVATMTRPLAWGDGDRCDLYTRATLAIGACDAGDEGEARRILDATTGPDLATHASEAGWGSALGMLADVAAALGTPAPATTLYDALAPFAGQLLATVLGLACLGAADRYLGMLATVLERWDAADAHFASAVGLETRARGFALLPRTRYWQARSLQERGGERAADALLARVVDDASALGLHALRADAEARRRS